MKNLNTTLNYKVIDISYGSLESGTVWNCEHCGRVIVNLATVESSEGNKYIVGMDCAKTLSMTPADWFEFEYTLTPVFKEVKAIASRIKKIQKELKVDPVIFITPYEPGTGFHKATGGFVFSIKFENDPIEFIRHDWWKNYTPQYQKVLTQAFQKYIKEKK